MNFRNISSWCIRNPVPPIVLFIGLMLAGLVAFAQMDVNNNPDIDFPAAEVNISQPGAAPTEMENQITQKVEANGVFAILPAKFIPVLQKKYFFYVWNEEISEVRLMASFDTREEDVRDFVEFVRKTVKP